MPNPKKIFPILLLTALLLTTPVLPKTLTLTTPLHLNGAQSTQHLRPNTLNIPSTLQETDTTPYYKADLSNVTHHLNRFRLAYGLGQLAHMVYFLK